jgi:GTP cyclohydrolase I
VDDRQATLERIGRELLEAIGEDPNRAGLVDTPARWARWWGEFTDHDPGRVGTAFEHVTSDDLVVVSGMAVWSLCEHHLLPFSATIAVGYLPNGHVLGLSKFGRIAHAAAHRLQVQERLVAEIADQVEKLTYVPDVAVVARGEHLCMTMRGIRTPATMTSSVMRGRFRELPELRAEFLSLTSG